MNQMNKSKRCTTYANAVKNLRVKMDNDVDSTLQKAKHINESRLSMASLRKQLQSSIKSFKEFRQKMASELRVTVEQRSEKRQGFGHLRALKTVANDSKFQAKDDFQASR
ncbi:hypothetical protein E3N88_01312 [Mikania micrantha]|uniref:Syntaxin N-terminal domain-containing protein n=1 Tax=Mikania micrantha TaxID=192012 RepID=A0A5N6Q289_9ASTR|nr:hypothetical protein E3N88_01312 [Mikania micrantha]